MTESIKAILKIMPYIGVGLLCLWVIFLVCRGSDDPIDKIKLKRKNKKDATKN